MFTLKDEKFHSSNKNQQSNESLSYEEIIIECEIDYQFSADQKEDFRSSSRLFINYENKAADNYDVDLKATWQSDSDEDNDNNNNNNNNNTENESSLTNISDLSNFLNDSQISSNESILTPPEAFNKSNTEKSKFLWKLVDF